MTNEDQALRQRCVELALGHMPHDTGTGTIDVLLTNAGKIEAFIKGPDGEKSGRTGTQSFVVEEEPEG